MILDQFKANEIDMQKCNVLNYQLCKTFTSHLQGDLIYAYFKGCINTVVYIQGSTKEFLKVTEYLHNLLKSGF